MIATIKNSIKRHREALRLLEKNLKIIQEISLLFIETLKKGGKIVFLGNGGSAADAQHLAAEFVGRFQKERKPLAAIALSVNSSTITALGNDFSQKEIFSRQIEALTKPSDCVVGISTSGKSKNIIMAIKAAKEIGAKTVCFLGKDGGKLLNMADITILVPHISTPRIQEMHILAGHIICEIVDNELSK